MKTNGVPKIRFKGFTDDWEQRKFANIAERKSETGTSNSILPSVEYEDVVSGQGILNKNIFEKNIEKTGIAFTSKDILYGKLRPYLHNWLNPNFTGIAVGDWWVLRPINADKNFLFRLIQTSQYDRAANQSTGTKMPRADWKLISDLEFRIPSSIAEQQKIGEYFSNLDRLITLHQRKCDQTKELKKFMLQKMFPKKGEKNPEIRFSGFTDDWEQRKFSELYKKVSRKNDMTYGTEQIISVANMYYKVDANVKKQDYLKTYNIFELGDIAFEGNKSKHFAHGRFVENTIGNGIVSHVFDVFKPIMDFDLFFWKYYINYEGVMGPILTRVTKASTMMTNLVAKDFLSENILVPSIAEQQKIGEYFSNLDRLITLHQRKCEQLKELKKFMLQNMFPKKG